MSGREPLHGEFWVYDDNGDWNRSTPKFIIFPDFNGEIFRVMIDQHWSQPDNQGELKGFTLRWKESSLDSYLIMDLFNPGGGPYPRPNGEPGDDRIFSKSGEQTGEIHANPFETMISVSLSDYNLKGNELLDVVFWEINSVDESEMANTEVITINLSEWTESSSALFQSWVLSFDI